jgi:hypothetical protein
VADHVLGHVVLEEAPVHVVHQRRGDRQQVARQPFHLLGHLEARHALAHERLVDIEVEQAHLGVGDLGQGLPVDAAQLQERDEREARREDRGHVAERFEVLVRHGVERGRRQPDARPEALDQRGLETGLVGGVVQRSLPSLVSEHRLDVAVGEAALPSRLADLVEPVAPLAQPGHDASVGHGRLGPLALPVELRDHALLRPAAERRGGDADALGRLLQREGLLAHRP